MESFRSSRIRDVLIRLPQAAPRALVNHTVGSGRLASDVSIRTRSRWERESRTRELENKKNARRERKKERWELAPFASGI